MSSPSSTAAARVIVEADASHVPAIARIYAHYVHHDICTFELEAPSEAEMARRRAAVGALGLPYLVALEGGEVVGYAYASEHRARPAYRHTIENSVYIHPDHRGRGVGGALLAELIERCSGGPWAQMVAVIGGSENVGSIAVHARAGFEHVGVLKQVGFKFDRWIDTVIMQRALAQAQPGSA